MLFRHYRTHLWYGAHIMWGSYGSYGAKNRIFLACATAPLRKLACVNFNHSLTVYFALAHHCWVISLKGPFLNQCCAPTPTVWGPHSTNLKNKKQKPNKKQKKQKNKKESCIVVVLCCVVCRLCTSHPVPPRIFLVERIEYLIADAC